MSFSLDEPRPKRRRQPAATRERLIRAASDVLTERGIDSASTDEIVRRAGLTNGAIYNHFANKDELLAVALEQEIASLQEMVAALDVSRDDTIEKLLEIVRAWHRLSPRKGGMIVEVLARARRDEAVRSLYLRLASAIEAAYAQELRRGQARGQVRGELQPEAIARLLTVIGAGYQAQATAGRPDIDPDAWLAVLVHLIESLRPRSSGAQGETA